MQCFLSSKEQHDILTCEGREQGLQSSFPLQSFCPTTEKQQPVLKCVLVPVTWGMQAAPREAAASVSSLLAFS